jgi:hypothetical protein
MNTENKTKNDEPQSLSTAELDAEIKHYQCLVEFAEREVNAGNERIRAYLESYANHRDSLQIRRNAMVANVELSTSQQREEKP